MNTKVINLKVDAATKRQAQDVAERLGFSLSSILKGYLRNFIKTKTLHFSLVEESEEPSDFLIQAIKEAKKDFKQRRTTVFETPEEEFHYLDSMIADAKKSAKS